MGVASASLPAEAAANAGKLIICPFTAVASLHQQYGGTSFYSIDSNLLGAGGDENNFISFLNNFNSNGGSVKKLAVLN